MSARVHLTALTALGVLLILLLPAIAGAQQRVAVLEFRNFAELKEQEIAYVGDVVRAEALRLPSQQYLVMTRENILELLPPETDLAACEGEWLETGRNLGAHYVVTGEVIKFGSKLKVSMKLYETATAALKGQQNGSAKDLETLEAEVQNAAARLFVAIGGPGPKAAVAGGGGGGGFGVGLPSMPVMGSTGAVDLTSLDPDALEKQQAALNAQRCAAAREVKGRFDKDKAKLARLMRLQDDVLSMEKKKTLQKQFNDAYGPWEEILSSADKRCQGTGPVKGGIKMVRMAGGVYVMGDGHPAQSMQTSVKLAPFNISQTEITVAQYKGCVDAGECSTPKSGGACNWGKDDRAQHPVNCVSWSQANDFAKWSGTRLPSESQWEFAARSAGKTLKYPWGNMAAICARAVMADGGSGCGTGHTAPVCSKAAGHTEQGLCDMAGNVWEWVADPWGDTYVGLPQDGKPREGSSKVHTIRGGSWGNAGPQLKTRGRASKAAAEKSPYLGFRVVR